MSKGLDKYLQDAEQCHALEVNHFDDTTRPTNISSVSEATEQVNESSKYNLSSAKQESMEEVESAVNILESLKIDTGLTSQDPSQPYTNTDEKHQQHLSPEHAEQDAVVHQDDNEHSAKNGAIAPTSTQSDQLLTVFFPTDNIKMSTEKVGCILVTSQLQQFLEDYPPSSDKNAFLDVYHMLSLLDKYLYDNPKQHTH